MSWVCPACEYENEDDDKTCLACEEARPEAATADDGEEDEYKHIHVGEIVECEDAPGTKLKKLKVNVGSGSPIDVVTAATNVQTGQKVVIACVGASIKGEEIVKTVVRGFPSQGMVCDSAMLGWAGGGAGAAVVLPDSFAVGSRPPASRPRPQ